MVNHTGFEMNATEAPTVCVAIGFCLGRTYTLTLLYNLNLRSSSRSASNRTMSTSLPGSAQRYPPEDTIDLAGINFIRTVHIDDAEIMPNGTSKSRANRSVRQIFLRGR
jgi:hypothetical protein